MFVALMSEVCSSSLASAVLRCSLFACVALLATCRTQESCTIHPHKVSHGNDLCIFELCLCDVRFQLVAWILVSGKLVSVLSFSKSGVPFWGVPRIRTTKVLGSILRYS